MTASEAIKIIKTAIAECEWNAPLDYAAAFDMAINALKQVDEMEKLKPCPFCGGEAKFVDNGDDNPNDGEPFEDWAVECVNCGILMVPNGKGDGSTTTRIEAAAEWNRRTGME